MKKLLILVMSCNDEHFINQEQDILNTWGKDIVDNKYDGVELLIYRGDEDINDNILNNHVLTLHCEDDINNTFKKTYYALDIVKNKYEYVFRTNTSTYVNIPLLLKLLHHCDENTLWTSELMSLAENPVPLPSFLYGRGNGLLMSNKIVCTILNEGINFLYTHFVDDVVIGNVLNSYHIKNNESYLQYLKSYPEAWYKCISQNGQTGHRLCSWGNTNNSFDFLKQFVTIQIRSWENRDIEHEHYLELYDVFKSNTDNEIDDTLAGIIEYSENPSVFIGSTLGFIDYSYYIEVMDKCPENLFNAQVQYRNMNDMFPINSSTKLL